MFAYSGEASLFNVSEASLPLAGLGHAVARWPTLLLSDSLVLGSGAQSLGHHGLCFTPLCHLPLMEVRVEGKAAWISPP
jgi:hypothetical protein